MNMVSDKQVKQQVMNKFLFLFLFQDWQNSLLPEFGGLPSLDKCIKYLQREILGTKRTSFINNPMFTEKKWLVSFFFKLIC